MEIGKENGICFMVTFNTVLHNSCSICLTVYVIICFTDFEHGATDTMELRFREHDSSRWRRLAVGKSRNSKSSFSTQAGHYQKYV